jgi:hypothetical protein
MTKTLTALNAKKMDFGYCELAEVKVGIRFNESLDRAREILNEELRNEASEFKRFGHSALDEASLYLEDALKALDKILRINSSQEKIQLKKKDERLGTRNAFEYYAKAAYLNTKRALPAIKKIWDTERAKKERFREVFAALDQVTTNLLLPFIKTKSLIEKVLTERENFDQEIEYTKEVEYIA